MTRWLRDFRLMPVVLLAIICLFALKSYGLLFDGGYTLGQRLGSSGSLVVTTVPIAPVTQLRSPAVPLETAASARSSKPSWMQEMFGYPGDVTGSIQTNKPAEKAAQEKAEAAAAAAKPPPPPPDGKATPGTEIPVEQPAVPSAGERALLERLQECRKELDARARELDLRESLVKAAEKKLGGAPGANPDEAKDDAKPAAHDCQYKTL